MPAGYETYNAYGSVEQRTTAYVGMFAGSFATNGAASGSFIDGRLIGRRILYFTPNPDNYYGGPILTLDPNSGTVSWSYQMSVTGGSNQSVPNHTVFYGGY